MSIQSMIDRHLPKQPHPETGEAFLPKFEIDTDSGNTLCEFYEREPMPPEDWYCDENGDYIDRSAEEMRALRADYEAAHADWVKHGSPLGPKLHVLPGVPVTTGKFVTASGARAEGVLLPDGTWRWTKLDWKNE
jgi:hypothetical protein